MEQGERFARWYDLDQGSHDQDIPFYLSLAQRTGSPILELGCGTGRLVIALAQAGYRVTGVDNLPEMLALAQGKVQAAGPTVSDQVQLVLQDLRQLALSERFSLAILAVNTLMHVAEARQQAEVLGRIFQHLRPGGMLSLDLFPPHPALLAPAEGELCLDKTLLDPETGRQALKFVARQVDYAQQTITFVVMYDEVGPQGQVTRTAASFPLRYLHRPEAEQLLRAAGFALEGVYGSYDLDAFQDGDERLLLLARRPS